METFEVTGRAWIGDDGLKIDNLAITPLTGGNGLSESKVNIGEKSYTIMQWGKDNNLPDERELLIQENNIVGELLATKRTIHLGAGLYFYRKEYVNGEEKKVAVEKPNWLTDFEKNCDVTAYLQSAAKNLFMHANVFTRFTLENNNKGRVYEVRAMECRHVRAEKQNNKGVIGNYFWRGSWKSSRNGDFPVSKIPAYDPTANNKQFMLHLGDNLLYDDYYYIPTYWGGRKWIELANYIPVFHLGNMKNGYLIRYHVQIPKDYFFDRTAFAQAQTEDQKKKVMSNESKAREKFIEKVNKILAGADNAGRTLFTEYEVNKQVQKEYPGIKITAIETDIKDEALLKLFERSNDANISGQGVPPPLAAIQTQGKLSSGSEIRNAHTMYTAIKTPTNRAILLKPLEMVKAANSSSSEMDIHIGIKDIQITTLDDNPAGSQMVTQK